MSFVTVFTILTAFLVATSGVQACAAEMAWGWWVGSAAEVARQLTPAETGEASLQKVVFAANFFEDEDLNYDGWPDGWTRRRGPRYPHFVEMTIQSDAAGGRYFSVQLDGGAAAAFSPHVAIDAFHGYVLRLELRTRDLKRDDCWVNVIFRNAAGQTVGERSSERFTGTRPWTAIELSSLMPPQGAVEAIVGLHVEPREEPGDITGGADFRGLVLQRFPRLDVSTAAPFQLHRVGESVNAACRVCGILDAPSIAFPAADTSPPLRLQWQLFNVAGQELGRFEQPVTTAANGSPAGLVGSLLNTSASTENTGDAYTGDAYTWSPGVLPPGFYRLRATLSYQQRAITHEETTLAVLAKLPRSSEGNFCWTLPSASDRARLAELEPLLREAGVQRLKMPLWLDSSDDRELDRMAIAIQRLGGMGIEVTGLMADPPASLQEKLGWPEQVNAVDLLFKPVEDWFPSLAPTMARLAVAVPRWQLGRDRERFLAEFGDIDQRVENIRLAALQCGMVVRLSMGWDWLQPLPATAKPPWHALVFSASPPLAADELGSYLKRVSTGPTGREVVIEPLDRRYDLPTRLADLVRRLVTCSASQVQAIVVPDPFHHRGGLCTPEGLPTEMFVPWRTTSRLLAGAKHLGSITLPGGSENAVFVRHGVIVMAVWNARPTAENLWLGDEVEAIDIWGQRATLSAQAGETRFQSGPIPIFLVGLEPTVARTRVALTLQHSDLPAEFGRPHPNEVSFESYFPDDVSGRVTLRGPDRWRVRPSTIDLRLAPGERFQAAFSTRPPFNAEGGRQLFAFDFDVTTDRRYQFRVYREVKVGAAGVDLVVFTWLDENDNLVVEQRLSQQEPSPTPFHCQLIVPQRRIQSHTVRDVGPDPRIHRYLLPGGSQLIGQRFSVRIAEQGGLQRMMQLPFVAEP